MRQEYALNAVPLMYHTSSSASTRVSELFTLDIHRSQLAGRTVSLPNYLVAKKSAGWRKARRRVGVFRHHPVPETAL